MAAHYAAHPGIDATVAALSAPRAEPPTGSDGEPLTVRGLLFELNRVGIFPPENDGESWIYTSAEPEPGGDSLAETIRMAAPSLCSSCALRAEPDQPEERTDWMNTACPFCPRCGYPDALDSPRNGSPLSTRSGAPRAEPDGERQIDEALLRACSEYAAGKPYQGICQRFRVALAARAAPPTEEPK